MVERSLLALVRIARGHQRGVEVEGRVAYRPRVLIGYSTCQATRQAFEDAGCYAVTCDLLAAPSQYHFQDDIWRVLTMHQWDFAVLHPMCTFLTCSAAWAYNDPDFVRYPGVGYHQKVAASTKTGGSRRTARKQALQNFQRLLDLPFPVGIENPAPSFVSTSIRPPDQIVQPYHYGNDASKSTGLWVTRGTPLLQRTGFALPRVVANGGKLRLRWANQTDSGQNKLAPSDTRWLERSKTYPGIAAAMGDQWGKWLIARGRG